MKKISLIVLIVIIGIGIFLFVTNDSNLVSHDTAAQNCASRDGETGVTVTEVIPGGFKVRFAVWDFTEKDGVPVINYTVLINERTAFCESTTLSMIEPGTFFYLKPNDPMPLDARGYPQENITVTATAVRLP